MKRAEDDRHGLIRSAALVLCLGLATLGATSLQSFRTLSWSDEIVYAVMGRNIATGRGVISNFYDARSILRSGFPLGDVHMPGNALILALSFVGLGPTEAAALLPSGLAFLLAGLLMHTLARRLFGRDVALTAAALFYLFPPLTGYAHSAMAELPLVLLSVVYLGVWCRAANGAGRSAPLLLALVLGLGATVRETFFVFVPSALYALSRRTAPARIRGMVVFGLAFSAYLLLILAPFSRARAPYPNFLSYVTDLATPDAIGSAVTGTALRNLTGLPHPGRESADWALTCQYVVGVFVPLFCLRFAGLPRRLATFLLVSSVGTFLALAGVYPFSSWAGVRAWMFVCPSGILLLSWALQRIEPRPLRTLALGFVAALAIFVSVRSNADLAADRIAAYGFDEPFSRVIEERTARFRPRTVMAELAFLYGWRAYPVSVIWSATAEPEELARLERVLPLDVILVGGARKEALIQAVRNGALKGGYQLVDEPSAGVYLFVSAEKARLAAR